jgi:hypothetical protein
MNERALAVHVHITPHTNVLVTPIADPTHARCSFPPARSPVPAGCGRGHGHRTSALYTTTAANGLSLPPDVGLPPEYGALACCRGALSTPKSLGRAACAACACDTA